MQSHHPSADERGLLRRGIFALFSDKNLILFLLAAMALTGGASRPDAVSQLFVRGIAFSAILICLFLARSGAGPGLRMPGAFLVLALISQLLQLIPLPPGLWLSLPGHQFLAQSDLAAGVTHPWRPIAIDPDRAWSAAISMVVPSAAWMAMAQMSARARGRLTGAIFGLSLASAVLGLMQLTSDSDSPLRWYQYTNDQSAVGFFANRNHNALLLALGLPFGAAWAMQSERRDRSWPQGWITLGASLFIIVMLPAVGSRTGLILGAVGALAALALLAPALHQRYRRARRKVRQKIVITAFSALGGLIALLILYGRNEAIVRLRDLDTTADSRVEALPILLQLVRDYFPFGAGAGAFDVAFRHVEPNAMLSTTYLNQAHNDVVQLALEGGLLAIGLALFFVGWWLWSWSRIFRRPASALVRAGHASAVAVLMTLIASCTDYPLRTPLAGFLLVMAAVILATAAAAPGEPSSSPGDRALRRIQS